LVALKACHRALGLEIDAESGASGWCGETMDYELAVSGLLDADAEGPPALERSLPLSISILAPVSLRVFG
jgi:hypothetical protein